MHCLVRIWCPDPSEYWRSWGARNATSYILGFTKVELQFGAVPVQREGVYQIDSVVLEEVERSSQGSFRGSHVGSRWPQGHIKWFQKFSKPSRGYHGISGTFQEISGGLNLVVPGM